MLGKLIVGMAGVFFGAFTVEYLRRKDPALLESLRKKAEGVANTVFGKTDEYDGDEGPDDEASDGDAVDATGDAERASADG